MILRRNSNKEYFKKQKYKFQAKHGTTFGMSHRGAPSHTVDHTSAQNVLSFNCKTKGRCSTAQIAIARKKWSTITFARIRDRGSFDQNSLDQNCLFSVDRNFHNQLTKIFDAFQLIEKFDQLPKKNWRILAVDQNFNNGIVSF